MPRYVWHPEPGPSERLGLDRRSEDQGVRLPPSTVPLPAPLDDAALARLAEDVFADGRVDPGELSAAVLLGVSSKSRAGRLVNQATGEIIAPGQAPMSGLAVRALEARAQAAEPGDPMASWLSGPAASPPLRDALGAALERDWLPALEASDASPRALRALEDALPTGTRATPKVLNTLLDWSLERARSPEAWRALGDIYRALWRGQARLDYADAAPRKLAFEGPFSPEPEDWAELGYARARARVGDGPLNAESAAMLLAFASAPGIPNAGVHRDLYALATRAAPADFRAEVEALHDHPARPISLLVIQAPDRNLSASMSFDTYELAAGLRWTDERDIHALVARKDPHRGTWSLLEPCPGQSRRFHPSVTAREIMISPKSSLSTKTRGGLSDLTPEILAYHAQSHPGVQSVLVMSSHGDGAGVGPTRDDQLSIAALGAAIEQLERPPVMVAFDACRMDTPETALHLGEAGVRWVHADDRSIDGVGFAYDRWLKDVGSALAENGKLGTHTAAEVGRWMRPNRWWDGPRGNRYAGRLIDARAGRDVTIPQTPS